MSQSDQFVDEVSGYLDQMIPTATDDELFAAGYLRGHFDLAVGTLEVAAAPFAKPEVLAQVNDSLSQAIANGELSEPDQLLVQQLWQQLQQLPA
ncbi:MAG: YfcL family protein [Alkalimonas sp.]|nr:YfcL family protein [Alkalimonas sp.]